MAFKYVGYGPPLVCWCDGLNICVEDPSGTVSKYPSAIGVEIPKQITNFSAIETMFVLKKDDITYYGRRQGTFSGIRMDGTLVRFGTWQAPATRVLEFIGAYRATVARQALIDTTDKRTVYIAGEPKAYVFHKPFDTSVLLPPAIGDMIMQKSGLRISTIKGEVNEGADGKWFIPSMPWSRDRVLQV